MDGVLKEKQIIVDGPTLMNQKAFYDAVIQQAKVWVPKMKATDFDKIMKMKFDARSYSDDYVEEAKEDMKFIKYFEQYIHTRQASTDPASLLEYRRPYYDQKKEYLAFDLNNFEDFLMDSRKVNMPRVDLVLKIQQILKATIKHGKIKDQNGKFVSKVQWRIYNYQIPTESLIVEGEAVEVKEITNDKT